MNENTTKRREWVKNAAIVFLTVMLILTFFSNTIMNYSLPEVATQNVTSASITAKVRGTGTVEASEPYNVSIKESRVIASVAVKQGTAVEKGDVLFILEDTESTELKEAQKQLDSLQMEYEKAILTADSSSALVDNVESGKTTSSASKLAQIDGYNKKIENLENTIKSYNNRIAEIDAELSKLGEATVDTSSEQRAVNDAAAALSKAESAVTAAQNKLDAARATLESVNSAVTDSQAKEAACKQAYDNAQAVYDTRLSEKQALKAAIDDAQNKGETVSPEDQAAYEILDGDGAGSVKEAQRQRDEALKAWTDASAERTSIEASIEQSRADAQKAVDNANSEYNKAVDNQKTCENKKAEAERNLANKQARTPDSSRQQTLRNEQADINLKLSQAQTEKADTEAKLQELLAGFGVEINLVAMLEQIREQKEVVAKLQEQATDATVTAPVSGTVSAINYVAGETTSPDMPLAQIVMTEKGFTCSFSVTAEQAKKISVGDVADIQNGWYYSDVTAAVAGFKADPSDPKKKLVVFDVTGDVQAGQSLSLSVGQKSANYDLVVPNSSIREDNNGKFILIVESKSGPLSTRYIATRIDVEVLASDDTQSAISAGLYGWEYVITTSSKPVEAGKQVRLADN